MTGHKSKQNETTKTNGVQYRLQLVIILLVVKFGSEELKKIN